ncbi:di-heme oxidoredictase family protein [Thalassotalea piscium]|uniref:CxxC motif-containing protein (DUF1111 family) n=1 Tax=Thalassotalea piscium TaxID=1230533 RepID=A0A7X0NH13_9GAMM|nr:di-heme oxidoredictase family protein [Thalassotalea piscium]MBB6543312.1 CxxC motif-containing protein (DUF1111 family) [Thalassotalea piscium]
MNRVKPLPPQKIASYALTLVCTLLINGCNTAEKNSTDDNTSPQIYPDYAYIKNLADTTTAQNVSDSGHGFSTPIPTLTENQLTQHLNGDTHFETSFTTAPNNEHPELDGLGPVFNNQNCNSCHQRDGRPSTISLADAQSRKLLGSEAGIFLRMSIEDGECKEPLASNNFCANTPVNGFGLQLFHRGVLKARENWQEMPFIGQANVYLAYEYKTITYSDNKQVTLKKPVFTIEQPHDVSSNNVQNSAILQANVNFSPRNGMPVFGLGLLELIPEKDIVALSDEHDSNNDGISGRANWVFDPIKAKSGELVPVSLGRFGWKANTPSVRVQALGALQGDMGVTNPLFPQESIANSAFHQSYLTRTGFIDTGTGVDGLPEASQEFSDDVVFYAETLAVPARRNIEAPNVMKGAQLFEQSQCSSCHHPDFITATDNVTLGGIAAPEALKGQHIYPFTDMLLHDMGEGLADNRRDYMATGKEWKTRPLWGIGLTKAVNPAAGFLHDGRAATIEEAILWHGGEAEQSKNSFMALTETDRNSLIAFVKSL